MVCLVCVVGVVVCFGVCFGSIYFCVGFGNGDCVFYFCVVVFGLKVCEVDFVCFGELLDYFVGFVIS